MISQWAKEYGEKDESNERWDAQSLLGFQSSNIKCHLKDAFQLTSVDFSDEQLASFSIVTEE